MKQKLPERRRFVRIDVPLKVVVESGNTTYETITKNVSPVGLRFEVRQELDKAVKLDLSLSLPSIDDPISLKGIVIWQRKVSLEDNAPFDVGVEIIDIEDKNKNVFLKYLCDLLYSSTYKVRT